MYFLLFVFSGFKGPLLLFTREKYSIVRTVWRKHEIFFQNYGNYPLKKRQFKIMLLKRPIYEIELKWALKL